MIGFFNRFLTTWPARVFFLVLLVSLVAWGVGDMLKNIGQGGAIATVDGKPLDENEFAHDMQRAMAQRTRLTPGAASAALKRDTATNVLRDMIARAAIDAQARRLHLSQPVPALQQAIAAMPGFQNNGTFDPQQYHSVLAENGLSEARFLELLRSQLNSQQLMGAIRSGAGASDTLTNIAFDFEGEKRVADTVTLPFAAAVEPAAPSEAQLRRYYVNHPDAYVSPEYRRIKAVLLTAESLARGIEIPDRDVQAAYDRNKDRYQVPQKRTVQVILTDQPDVAKKLAALWRKSDWAAMQDAAKQANATATVSENISKTQIPSPVLADEAFKASLDQVIGPLHDSLGWDVARVTAITPGIAKSFDQMRAELHGQLAQAKAGELLYARVNKVQDALASGTKLDELPADLGLAAIAGSLDRQGLTPDGEPAPIPAAPAIREALIAAVFSAQIGDAPQLAEVHGAPGQPAGYYAFELEKITAAAPQPFEKVEDKVRQDWLRQARRHEQDVQATALMMAAKAASGGLRQAAQAARQPLATTPAVMRPSGDPRKPHQDNVPVALARVLFGLKPNDVTMVETSDGFVVAQLKQVMKPDRKTDQIGYGIIHDRLGELLADDIENIYENVVIMRSSPRINNQRLNSLAQISE